MKINALLIGNLEQRLKIKFENDMRQGMGYARYCLKKHSCEITIQDRCFDINKPIPEALFKKINLIILVPQDIEQLFSLRLKIPGKIPMVSVNLADCNPQLSGSRIISLPRNGNDVKTLASSIYCYMLEAYLKRQGKSHLNEPENNKVSVCYLS